MTLFVLLLVMAVERHGMWQRQLKLEQVGVRYLQHSGAEASTSVPRLLLIALFPPVVVAMASNQLQGLWLGFGNLCLWLVVGLFLFSHHEIRQRFRAFLFASAEGDIATCHRSVQQLDACHRRDRNEQELGQHMGELAAWINYRYYAAVAFYFVLFGPAVALFYSLVRDIHDHHSRKQLPQLVWVLHLLDWVPVRIVAFSFAFAGRFQQASSALIPYLLAPTIPARQLITEVAVAAEEIPARTSQPICIRPTIAMLRLVKRNLTLLLMVVSFLTIFGVLQ